MKPSTRRRGGGGRFKLQKAFALGLALTTLATIPNCRRSAPGPSTRFDGVANHASRPTSNAGTGRDSSSPRASRTLRFSGYDWAVKSSEGRVGPGPNYFSDRDDNVAVDAEGRLHLRVTQRDGSWFCAEVISTRSFGYGTYRFYLDGAVDSLDPRIILGMFTWNDDPAYNHREIDIEVSRWGRPDNENGQFVVQPYQRSGNVTRFQIPTGMRSSTHSFVWGPDRILCRSLKGHEPDASDPDLLIHQHTFTEGVPRAGGENARINLWLLAGRPPADGKEVEIVISKFEFVKPD